MAKEGICTLWFTFSAADNHWVDLFSLLLGDDIARAYEGKNEKEKAVMRRDLRRLNPHIVDAYFYKRFEYILDSFFGPNSPLKAAWKWFRIEYQQRGKVSAANYFVKCL